MFFARQLWPIELMNLPDDVECKCTVVFENISISDGRQKFLAHASRTLFSFSTLLQLRSLVSTCLGFILK